MRAGGFTVQQALTPEAAIIVKQAVGLAKRRGHPQVTPLHVAITMLTSPSALLRVACLHSHSHPLQCKALHLCFNVALNRLPATFSSGNHALSNALVAAFKRAQAHQRRGSAESQHQPPLTVKIELQHLIISILDDPSVSRVMREAGFSSTQVKANVEQAISSDDHNPHKPKEATSDLDLSLKYSSDLLSPVTLLRDGANFQPEAQTSCSVPVRALHDEEEKKRENINNPDCLIHNSILFAESSPLRPTQDSVTCKDHCSFWNFMGSSGNINKLQRLERTSSFTSLSPLHYERSCFRLFSGVCSTEHDEQRSSVSNLNSIYVPRFKELCAENLKALCSVLEGAVPWHKETIPDIASAILQCRSGLLKRKWTPTLPRKKEDTWLFFEGNDSEGKKKISRELSSVVFGSPANFVRLEQSKSSPGDIRSKRCRSDASHWYMERFIAAIRDNPHRVIMMEDVELLGHDSQVRIKDAIERGRIQSFRDEQVTSLSDAVIILSCKSFHSYKSKLVSSDGVKQKNGSEEEEISSCVSLDLNISCEDGTQLCSSDGVGLLEAVDMAFLLNTP